MPDRTLAAADDTVVVTGRGVLCLELRTGRTLWSVDPEDTGADRKGRALYGGATIDGRTVCLSSDGPDLLVVERDRRKRRWSWSHSYFWFGPVAPPLLAGGYVFPRVAASTEDACAVDLRTHKTAWTLKSVDAEAADLQLLADSQRLYVLRGSRLRGFPLT